MVELRLLRVDASGGKLGLDLCEPDFMIHRPEGRNL